MPKISTYNTVTPTLNDKVIGTDKDNNNATKNFTIADIVALSPGGDNSVQSLNALVGALSLIPGNSINIDIDGTKNIVVALDGDLDNILSMNISTPSGDDFFIKSILNNEVFISISPDNEVALYYNNDKKCETTSYGFRVGGDLRVTGLLDLFQQNDNTFAGTNAGNLKNILGSTNTGFGENTQAVQSNGQSNSSLGFGSLTSSVSGNNNTAIGTFSMTLSNGGSFNTALGSSSLNNATTGQGNTAIGRNSLYKKTTSNYNTAVGNESLSELLTGFRNTALGNDAGSTLTTGSRNISIGDNAQPKTPATNGEITLGDTNQSSFRIPAIQQGTADGSQLEYEASSDSLILKETQTLIPEFITATPGGSSTITTQKNIIELTWVGGVGTYFLTLPSATAIPYRFLRIVNGSTVTASDKVRILAPLGETINGVSFIEISKPYKGLAVWSSGSEWIVIQSNQ